MHRRRFIRNSLITSTGLLLLPDFVRAGAKGIGSDLAPSLLERHFINPPASARPYTYWMWMNGNITKEGITLDLEAMDRMGISGAYMYNNAVGIPAGTIAYGSEAWTDITLHALKEAERLNIRLLMHNSPGYSGTGGPWITPEQSMQELVWTETLFKQGMPKRIVLPRPFGKLDYYRDAYVLAYPSLPVEQELMKDKLMQLYADGKPIDKSTITDGNLVTKARIEPQSDGQKASLLLEFAMPFNARAITILRDPESPVDPFDGPRDYPPVFSIEVSDDGKEFKQIGLVHAPPIRAMNAPATCSFDSVSARYFKLVSNGPSWITQVELHNGPRIPGWASMNDYGGSTQTDQLKIGAELIIDPESMIDLSHLTDHDGNLDWDVPNGNWTILRIGHTTTGEVVGAAPESGIGLECDKFSKSALDFHFEIFLDKLFSRFTPYMGHTFEGLLIDSWEAGKQNWSVGFPEEFKKRRGYDLWRWLPAMTGRVLGSVADTARFLYDIRATHADLVAENYYGHFKELCHRRGLALHGEPYGDGTFDSLQSAKNLDVTMGEFWTRYIYGDAMYSRQAVSASHGYGNKIAASESFTGMPATSRWTEYPYSLKAEGDWFYTIGLNRLVFHTFVHQPYSTATPGMTMGPFGTHFDRNSTWTKQASGWISYLAKTQSILQQGIAVADVCYFKGEEPVSGIPGFNQMGPLLPNGYAADVFGKDILLNQSEIKNGKLTLPDGMSYHVCVMAPVKMVSCEVLTKIIALVRQGLWMVVSSRPVQVPGLYQQRAATDRLNKLVDELWGGLDGKIITQVDFGKGKLFWGESFESILTNKKVQPDFNYSSESPTAVIHYTHRIVEDADVYFVSNHLRQREKIVCNFRITGRQPEIWEAENGKIYDALIYEEGGNGTALPLTLEPAGSLFVVFRKKSAKKYMSVLKDGAELYTVKSYNSPNPAPYPDVQNNFTVVLWAKPDTYAHSGKSMLIYPPQGGKLYGMGHAVFGLSAGQNAVRVYEREQGMMHPVLVVEQPLEGWTHIAVVYSDGRPSLFINGKFITKNDSSGKIIHPGLDNPADEEQFQSYFEGNSTRPRLINKPLSEAAIAELYKIGIPEPVQPSAIEIEGSLSGSLSALIWENGTYLISRGHSKKIIKVLTDCKARLISGPWEISFPAGTGTPLQATLPQLSSLHLHAEFGIRHFSGTMTYFKTVEIHASDIAPGKQIFLDLGRVEVVAEVVVNGRNTGLLWKEPYRTNITYLLKVGINLVEIKVTNLWPNRIIGDEYLPVENDYDPHGPIRKLPDWYVNNLPKPGERHSFCVWHHYYKTDPLLASGLLGPVKLLTAIEEKWQ